MRVQITVDCDSLVERGLEIDPYTIQNGVVLGVLGIMVKEYGVRPEFIESSISLQGEVLTTTTPIEWEKAFKHLREMPGKP